MIGYKILAFPTAILLANILQSIYLLFFLVRTYPNVKLKFKEHKFIDRKEILSYTTKFQILKWVQTLRSQYISIAINNLTGPLEVVKYNFTYRIPQIVPNYALKIVHPFFPSISDLFDKGELSQVRSVFNKISLILFRIAFFAGITIVFLNESFITLWVGSDKFAGNFVLYLLVAYLIVFVSLGAFGIIIFASKNFEKWTKWSIVEILFSIISSYYLSFKFGLTGIVIGYVLGSFISQFYLFRIVLNQIKLNKSTFLFKMIKYAFFSNFYSLVFGIIMSVYCKIDNWIYFILAILGFVFFAIIKDFILVINSKEIGLKNKIQKSIFS
jgi:O-antigen/teichoic acid export membrane protein